MSASFVYLDENNNLSTTNSALSGLFPTGTTLTVDLEFENKFSFGTNASDNIIVGNTLIKEVDIISENLNISGNVEVIQNINVTDRLVSNILQVKDKLLDSNEAEGTIGKILVSTSTGKLEWGDAPINIDLTTSTELGTSAVNSVSVGNLNNQTIDIQGSIINLRCNNRISNKSTVSSGIAIQFQGVDNQNANANDYDVMTIYNTNDGTTPYLRIMDGAGFTNTASKTLTTDSNGKLLWATPSSGGISQSEDTANDFIKLGNNAVNNTTYPSGANQSFVMEMPIPITISGNFYTNFIWWGGNLNTTSFNNITSSIILGRNAFWGYGNVGTNSISEVVAIGHGVAQFTHTANESIFIGQGAGYLGGTSNQCVYIGDTARTNTYNSSYSNAVCLGYAAEITSSNQCAIGNNSMNSFRIYGGWSNVSDRRDKYDIVDTVYGLDFLNKLRVVDYKYNYRNRYKKLNEETKEHYYETDNKQYAGTRTHTGLISQEVKQVLDNENKDHSMFQINNYKDSSTNPDDGQHLIYQETISMCIKAIQELTARVIELEKKNIIE